MAGSSALKENIESWPKRPGYSGIKIKLSDADKKPGGLYVHVPFCIKKCFYCDFYSVTDMSKAAGYVAALETELAMAATGDIIFDTLYFGGGTPSTLPFDAICRIIDRAAENYCITPDAQITIEANPGTLTTDTLKGYRAAGVNRINIGIQSFKDDLLKFMGRIHTAKQGITAVSMAETAGFDNIGIDLIYGFPGQTLKIWQSEMAAAVALSPAHISCYMLTYESGTPLERRLRKGLFTPLDEDITARLFLDTISYLDAHGYRQYEISNFAKQVKGRDFQSKHNLKYWNFAPYLGFGPSAHSFSKHKRWWNHGRLEPYLKKIHNGELPVKETENLDRFMMLTETLYLGLRQTAGIDLKKFQKQYGVRFEQMFDHPIASLEADGFIISSQNRCGLTAKGMLYLDSIAAQFIDRIQ